MDNTTTVSIDSTNRTTTSNVEIDISNTAILEYLDIVKSEYEIERNKKQSFENRAGLILALIGAICIFVFEKVKFKDIFILMNTSLTFCLLLKIITGIFVYIGFSISVIMILRTITVYKQNNFDVKCIDEDLIIEPKRIALCRMIFTYRDIIIQHRVLNEKRARSFKWCLYGLSLMLISTLVYLF